MNEKKAAAYRTGVMTLIGLAVLTLIEYIVGVGLTNPTVPLVIMAVLKAGIILHFFMHVTRLWREEEH